MIFVGVEQQIGRLRHENAAMTERHAGGKIQSGDEVLEFIRDAIAVRIFANRDPVRALRPARRRLRDAIIFRAEILIHAHCCQPGGIRILQILHNPHAAAFIEAHRDRLANVRFTRDQLHFEAIGNAHSSKRFLRRRRGWQVTHQYPEPKHRAKLCCRCNKVWHALGLVEFRSTAWPRGRTISSSHARKKYFHHHRHHWDCARHSSAGRQAVATNIAAHHDGRSFRANGRGHRPLAGARDGALDGEACQAIGNRSRGPQFPGAIQATHTRPVSRNDRRGRSDGIESTVSIHR